MNRPTEPGFYWAREKDFRWWNVIVQIAGEPPWLEVGHIFSRSSRSIGSISGLIFGPKIEVPPDPEWSNDK